MGSPMPEVPYDAVLNFFNLRADAYKAAQLAQELEEHAQTLGRRALQASPGYFELPEEFLLAIQLDSPDRVLRPDRRENPESVRATQVGQLVVARGISMPLEFEPYRVKQTGPTCAPLIPQPPTGDKRYRPFHEQSRARSRIIEVLLDRSAFEDRGQGRRVNVITTKNAAQLAVLGDILNPRDL
jgi:hypothetical protein